MYTELYAEALLPPRGGRVAIVAGGPSLIGVDWEDFGNKLEAHYDFTIAINRAYQKLPRADVLYWSDWKFFRHHADGIRAHAAEAKITALRPEDSDHGYAGVVNAWEGFCFYKFTGPTGLDWNPYHLRHGNSSGYAALNLAAHTYPREIHLYGYDLKRGPKGETHWHDGHGFGVHDSAYDSMLKAYEGACWNELFMMGITVFNHSPDSRISVFPKLPLWEMS